MDPGLHAAMSLGGFQRPLLPGEKIAQKIRLILETKPGSIPWRPKFGCDPTRIINLLRRVVFSQGGFQQTQPTRGVVGDCLNLGL